MSNKSLARADLNKQSCYKYLQTDIIQQPMTVPHPSLHIIKNVIFVLQKLVF